MHKTDEFRRIYYDTITDMDVDMASEEMYNDLIDMFENKYRNRPIGEIIDSLKLVIFQSIHMALKDDIKKDEAKFRRENK